MFFVTGGCYRFLHPGWACNSYSLKLHQLRVLETWHVALVANLQKCLLPRLRYCFLYAKFFFLDCFGEAQPSFGRGRNWQNVNHFKFTTLLEYKFGAKQYYRIIKSKNSQIQWMPIEYNKSHMQDILKKNAKIAILHNCIVSLEKSFQKRVHGVSSRFPNTFICFLVLGNRDETLALVFEIILTLTSSSAVRRSSKTLRKIN